MSERVTEFHELTATPCLDEEGRVILYDLWIDDEWIGSRRTVGQSLAELSRFVGAEVLAEDVRGW